MPSRPVRAPNRMILLPVARRERQVQILLAQHADAQRVHQRVARIGGVEDGLATDVGQPQGVSVAADAAHHTVDHAAGIGCVGGAEPQLVHHRDRAGPHRHDVADDAADTGGRALVRLDVRRVVVRFDLERDRPAVADVDDARVLADARQHRCAHLLGGGLAEVAQVHLGGLVGAVLAPHHRVHRQLGVGRAAAEDLADPLVLVVLEAEFAERLRLVGSGCGVLDGVDHLGEPGRHAASLVCAAVCGRWRGHVGHRRTQNALPSGSASTTHSNSPKFPLPVSRGTEVDQALDLGLPVGGTEVDVHAVLARGGVVDLSGTPTRGRRAPSRRRKTGCDGIYLPVERTGPPIGELLGVGGVDRDVFGLERHASTLCQAGDKSAGSQSPLPAT